MNSGPHKALPGTTIQGRALRIPRWSRCPSHSLPPSHGLSEIKTEIPSLEYHDLLFLPLQLLWKY